MTRRDPRVHVLNIDPGECFRFTPDGPTFRAVEGPLLEDGKTRRRYCERVVPPGSRTPIREALEFEGCMVYRVEEDAPGAGDDDAD